MLWLWYWPLRFSVLPSAPPGVGRESKLITHLVIDITVNRAFLKWSHCQVKFQRRRQLSGLQWLSWALWRWVWWKLLVSTSNSCPGGLPSSSLYQLSFSRATCPPLPYSAQVTAFIAFLPCSKASATPHSVAFTPLFIQLWSHNSLK